MSDRSVGRSIADIVVGSGGTRALRGVHVLLISIAAGIVAMRIVDGGGGLAVRPAAAMSGGDWTAGLAAVAGHLLPAVAGAAASAAVLLVVSGSDAGLALLDRLGLAGIGERTRGTANGLVWSAIALLAVKFTAPAFGPIPGGPLVAGAAIAVPLGIGTARLHRAALAHEGYRTFNLVAMLLAAGSIASMSLTPTGDWWTRNFSTLGTSDDIAAACFNIAIVVSGAGMALLGPVLSAGLRNPRFEVRRGGLIAVRVLIAVIGCSLVGVGLVPIDRDPDLHNVFACGAALGFAGAAGGVRRFARRMPRTLVVFSYVALAIEVAAMIGYDAAGIFNLTVFEVVAFSLVFAWLIALAATTGGAEASGHRVQRRTHLVWRRRARGRARLRSSAQAPGPEFRRPAPPRTRHSRPGRRVPRTRTAQSARRTANSAADEPPDGRGIRGRPIDRDRARTHSRKESHA